MNELSLEKTKLKDLIASKALLRGDFTLASGLKSDFYLDTRLISLSAEGLGAICAALWPDLLELREKYNATVLAGPALGAIPIISALSLYSGQLGLPFGAAIIRQTAKQHGTGKMIEGALSAGENVILVEDVVTSGKSSLMALEALRAHGCIVKSFVCLVKRDDAGEEALRGAGIEDFRGLFALSELLGSDYNKS